MISFKPLRLAARSEYEHAIGKFPTHSDFNFTSVFAWDETAEYALLGSGVAIDLAEYHGEGRLISFMAADGVHEIALSLLDYAHSRYGSAELRLIPDWMLTDLSPSHGWSVVEDDANADYLFSPESLARLAGAKFKNKRQEANRFARTHNPEFITLDLQLDTHRRALDECFDQWTRLAPREDGDIQDELRAFTRLLAHADALNVEGAGVVAGDGLVAFCLYEVNSCAGSSTSISHFEKAITTYAGITEYLKRAVAEVLSARGVECFNWEQDLGLPGLREAKRRFYPVGYRRKHTLRLNNH